MSFPRRQVADIRPSPGEHILVKLLLPVDEVKALLQLVLTGRQLLPLACKHLLALRDAAFSLRTERQIGLHLLDAALFEARQAADPRDVALIEDVVIVRVALDAGDKPHVAVELEGFVADKLPKWADICRQRDEAQ